MNNTFTYLLSSLAILSIAACDDSTGTLGIYSDGDEITNSTEIFDVTTRSLKLDSVVASSSRNYLGCITDMETGTDISADFAAQFYCFEDYTLPLHENMVGDVNGKATKVLTVVIGTNIKLADITMQISNEIMLNITLLCLMMSTMKNTMAATRVVRPRTKQTAKPLTIF